MWSPSGSLFCIGGMGWRLATRFELGVASHQEILEGLGRVAAGACCRGALCKGAKAGGVLQEQSIVTQL